MAKSWITWGAELTVPRYGAITVVKRSATQFHVGFFVGITKKSVQDGWDTVEVKGKKKKIPKMKQVDYVTLIGGNQGKIGEITESASWTVSGQLVAYRWPADKNKL